MRAANNTTKDEYKDQMLASMLRFTQIFYLLRTGRKFELSYPDGRESHYVSICRALTRVMMGETTRLIINVFPRSGKTELLINFIAWVLAHFPDSNNIYVSYAHTLAKKQTQTIKEIMQLREYKEYFGVEIKGGTSAKDNFETTAHGSVYGVGAGGTITGRGAGVKGVLGFRGAIVIDDILKPDEATSDTIREGVIDWFYNTLQSRLNSPHTPIIFIGQRLHEQDLAGHLIESGDWETLILPSLDEANNSLQPDMFSVQQLLKMKQESPYVFYSQHQQTPVAPGGNLYQPEWFPQLDFTPKILKTFVTVDSAETDRNYNDATVFSFFGIYQAEVSGEKIDGMYNLHWIDCVEIWIEPKDLQNAFMQFWINCLRYPVKPQSAAIEKKSSGVTLCSMLKNTPGLYVHEINRAGAKDNKALRFLEIQPYVAQGRISLPSAGKHTQLCLDHMSKITANMVHRRDDICDTLAQGVKMGLIDKVFNNTFEQSVNYSEVSRQFAQSMNKFNQIRQNSYRKH